MNQQMNPARYQPIENYGIIGNLDTIALVSLEGSIDFMCFPQFDSPTIFCKLLDADKGGSFSIKPLMADILCKQLYLPDTNVLVTRFLADEGIAEIIDYMPVYKAQSTCSVFRKITTVRGNINYQIVCAPRFNYAAEKHELKKKKGSCLFVSPGEQPSLRLLTDIPLDSEGQDIRSEFVLKEGETICFVLEADQKEKIKENSLQDYADRTYRETINYWQSWIAKSNYKGAWKEMVDRSALTLKLLLSSRYGSMVAAPTFSLPESIGNSRNWDYRYTWIRDAAFSMHAFLQLGFMEEADLFLSWIKKQSTDKELQLMFAIDGDTRLKEKELDYLEGYEQSRPVRIGNNASSQAQMDIYGELLETIYIYVVHGGDLTYDYWKTIVVYTEFVIHNWRQPDHSIWEVRGKKREFLFSRMMCWVALDRAIKIADHFSFPYAILEWHEVRDEILKDLYDNFWNEEKQAFVQYKGASNLDAAAMLLPILNVISSFSEQWKKTMKAIDKELRSDVLIYRYREQSEEIDGLKGKEGTFTMCSFWHVECLALSGQTEKAKEHFEKMLGYANHLGLFSEQLGMKGQHLGNFPQAFTHLALISAAIALSSNKQVHGITQIQDYKTRMK